VDHGAGHLVCQGALLLKFEDKSNQDPRAQWLFAVRVTIRASNPAGHHVRGRKAKSWTKTSTARVQNNGFKTTD